MADLLFDPDAVAGVLDDLPALDALLGDPHAEGHPSKVFRGMKVADCAMLARVHPVGDDQSRVICVHSSFDGEDARACARRAPSCVQSVFAAELITAFRIAELHQL